MATKKKTRKKSKKTSANKAKPAVKLSQKRRSGKKSAKRKITPKKAVAKKKGLKRTVRAKATQAARKKKQGRADLTFSDKLPAPRSSILSGDLQGLSNLESADSESVDELVEEGNAFEAGIVSGVQEAGSRGVKEVRTREVPEDDVPEEYLDQD
jgi:hypothetical protein